MTKVSMSLHPIPIWPLLQFSVPQSLSLLLTSSVIQTKAFYCDLILFAFIHTITGKNSAVVACLLRGCTSSGLRAYSHLCAHSWKTLVHDLLYSSSSSPTHSTWWPPPDQCPIALSFCWLYMNHPKLVPPSDILWMLNLNICLQKFNFKKSQISSLVFNSLQNF